MYLKQNMTKTLGPKAASEYVGRRPMFNFCPGSSKRVYHRTGSSHAGTWTVSVDVNPRKSTVELSAYYNGSSLTTLHTELHVAYEESLREAKALYDSMGSKEGGRE